MIDPVSGNDVPPGATAKEVRDDIPIMASENEYVIPANVVRYIGLKNIEKMVSEAREALGDKSETGPEQAEEDEEDDELPFDMSELDEPEEDIEHMAEGGVVSSGGSEIKAVKNADGQTLYIPFYNGRPLYNIPEGYSEQATSQPEKPLNIDKEQGGATVGSGSDSDETRKFIDENKSALAGNPSEWSVDDFSNFSKSKSDPANSAIKGIISMMPGGKLAMTARSQYLDKAASERLDQMLETGVDAKGTPLTEDQIKQLNQTKTDLINQMGATSKLNLNPLDKLTNVFQQFQNFTSSAPSTYNPQTGTTGNAPISSLSNDAYKSTQSFSTPGQSYTKSESDENRNSNSRGLGSDMGRDPSKGPSEGSMASGGLYNKGGLITRRKPK